MGRRSWFKPKAENPSMRNHGFGVWRVRSRAESAPQSPLVIHCKPICKSPMSRPGLSLCNLKGFSSHVPNIVSDCLNVAHLLLIVTSFCLQTLHFFPNWNQAFGFCFQGHAAPKLCSWLGNRSRCSFSLLLIAADEFCMGDRVSLCSSGWPGTRSNRPASAFQVIGS